MKAFISIFMCGLALVGFAQSPDAIVGDYWTPKKDGRVLIYESAGKYYGKTVWAKNPRKDIYNPDQALRQRDLIGLIFLTDFIYKNGEYIEGKIYDRDNGKTYQSKMWIEEGNVKVRGFIGISLLGRTEIFEKVKK